MITLIAGKRSEGYRELNAQVDGALRRLVLPVSQVEPDDLVTPSMAMIEAPERIRRTIPQEHGAPETKVPSGVETTGRRVTPE